MNLHDLAGLAGMTGLSEAHRPIRLRLSHQKGVSDNGLLVKHVSGVESMCGGLEYRLLCVATQAGLPTKQFLAMPVELQFVTDAGNLRSVCGIVASAEEGQSDGGLATYRLTVRDALALMDQRINSRVFRTMSEIDITDVLLSEWRQNNPVLAHAFRFDLTRLRRTYPARELTRQYNESDSAFLRRLWKRRGVAWFFEPGQSTQTGSNDTPAHTLVLFDHPDALKQNAAGSVRYHRDDGTEQRDSITAWQAIRTLTPGLITRQSWDYARVGMMSASEPSRNDQGELGNQFAASLDQYVIDSPHAGDNSDDYRDLGTARMQHHEYAAKRFRGESGIRDLVVGEYNQITGHPELDTHPAEEREFVITELQVDAENNLPKAVNDKLKRLFAANRWAVGITASAAAGDATRSSPDASGLDQASAERGARYTNQFTCVRRGIAIVPDFDARRDVPRAETQTVIVVGPPGEEVHCDEQGRVKVRFPECRPEDHAHASGAGTSNSARDSAWVRVSSSWASGQWGANWLPRAGDECLITNLNGDPDKPVITGRVYNGKAPPPTFSHRGGLPGNRYVAGIKSKEVKGQRYNQLRLDDTPGQISAQLASEHARSELNLGYLTHPRSEGKGDKRGDGFELTSDASGCIRTAKSLLISAWQRLNVSGNQLSREEHLALMQDCLDLFKSLGQYAADHQGLALDSAPQAALRADVNAAAAGSNIEPDGQGGKPTISLTAPAGIAFTTPKTLVSYAGVNVDTVAQQHLQTTSGGRTNINAGKGISLFAHQDGIVQIAHNGKFLIQSQHDGIQLDSAKDIKATAGTRFTLMAHDEITLITSGGAYLKLSGGAVELGGPDALTVKTSGHNWNGAASMSTDLPTFGDGDLGRTPKLLRPTDGSAVEGMRAHIERADEGPLTGQTDGAGKGPKVVANRLQQLKAYFFAPRS